MFKVQNDSEREREREASRLVNVLYLIALLVARALW